jgi:biopolymer transport protein ExbB/TolQ
MKSSLRSNPLLRKLWEYPDRVTVMAIAVVSALIFIAIATIVLDPMGRAAQLIFDRRSPHFPYPFTIQNFEHVILFIGLGELYVRWRMSVREEEFLHQGLLPEDDATVLQSADLGPIRRQVAKLMDSENGFVPSLIDLSILQFQSGRSIDQTVAVMTSSLELIQHRVDLRYGLIRYIAWFIPTLGFIGTVIGLGASLASVPETGDVKMYQLAQTLSVGFDCTMVALVWSAILVFIMQLVQEKEELCVNRAGDYTLRNLINRLYAGPAQ